MTGPYKDIEWEELRGDDGPEWMYRSKVPGGWLLWYTGAKKGHDCGLVFMPDPDHQWMGG